MSKMCARSKDDDDSNDEDQYDREGHDEGTRNDGIQNLSDCCLCCYLLLVRLLVEAEVHSVAFERNQELQQLYLMRSYNSSTLFHVRVPVFRMPPAKALEFYRVYHAGS